MAQGADPIAATMMCQLKHFSKFLRREPNLLAKLGEAQTHIKNYYRNLIKMLF